MENMELKIVELENIIIDLREYIVELEKKVDTLIEKSNIE